MNNLRFADQTGFMFNTFIAANMVVYFLLIFRKKLCFIVEFHSTNQIFSNLVFPLEIRVDIFAQI